MGRLSATTNQLLFLAGMAGCAPTATNAGGQAGASGGPDEAGASATGSGGESGHASGAGNSEAGAADESAGAADAGAADAGAANAGAGGESGSYPLFNGVDFSGWDRYLGKPSAAEPALGLDNDPLAVYSIVTLDAEPAIRISGQVFGSLISKREFCNFRLRVEYKWGTAQWPPLTARDSGVMFLSTGPLGAVNAGGNPLSDPIGSGGFMVSSEYQIADGQIGSLYNLGPIAFNTTLSSPGSQAADWNQIEITLQDDVASLLLNEHEVTRASGFQLNWPDQPSAPLRCGKIQLQSEGHEIFFRHVEIEELP